MKKIYADYAASTPLAGEVFLEMKPYFAEKFGNPGSLHAYGQEAIAGVDKARERIAAAIGAEFRDIVFTASATEANNLALRGAVKKFRESGKQKVRIVVSAIEHESILETAHDLEQEGVEVVRVAVDAQGIIDIHALVTALNENTAIVSVMYVNNEIGTVEPIAKIAEHIKAFRKNNAWPLLHTDAAQAFSWYDCNVKELGVDLMTLSSHKMYGPKGAAALYKNTASQLAPTITGGGQEFDLRSGTENVPAIVGFAKAIELANATRKEETKRVRALKQLFIEGVRAIAPGMQVNGNEQGATAPHIVNIYFPKQKAQELLTKLDRKGVAASSGSACRSRALEASYVIEALGHPKERALGSIRFSFGRQTTQSEVEELLKILKTCL